MAAKIQQKTPNGKICQSCQLSIIHLYTQILFIATMFGVILTKQIWKNLQLSRNSWYVLSQDPLIGPILDLSFMQIEFWMYTT